MSFTFTLKGVTSVLSVDFYPPIELDPESTYSLALIGFHTYNTFPNIEEGANKFYYREGPNEPDRHVIIPTGSYEIDSIEQYLQRKLSAPQDDFHERERVLSLKPNNNTLKCELRSSKYAINFSPEDSIGKLLGFSKNLLQANVLHESDLPVEIVKVITIRIECNIISGAFHGIAPSHTLYEFSPTSDPGFAIDVEPVNQIFLPVNKRSIDNITVTILDQNSELVDFRGEQIIVRLVLRKDGSGSMG